MKDKRLVQLNFSKIVDYGGQPPSKSEYDLRQRCKGYCVSCEKAGLLDQANGRLDLMSHGCDFSDFEAALGPMPKRGSTIKLPVLFLLENPGGDYGNGDVVEFDGVRKQPPVYGYYWIPNIKSWPISHTDLKDDFYGPYFALLMWRHQLRNVYVTNVVKCRWVGNDEKAGKRTPDLILQNCVDCFLAEEVRIFSPGIVFCFGGAAEKAFNRFREQKRWNCVMKGLYHPQWLASRCRVSGKPRAHFVQENDRRIKDAVAQVA